MRRRIWMTIGVALAAVGIVIWVVASTLGAPQASPSSPRSTPGSSPQSSAAPRSGAGARAGTRAWARALPALFHQETGAPAPAAFWLVPDPLKATIWWAFDPVVVGHVLWAGQDLNGRWSWWPVSLATGRAPNWHGQAPPTPMSLTVRDAASLVAGQQVNPNSPANGGVHPWDTVTGTVQAPVGWQALTNPYVPNTVYLTIYLPAKGDPRTVYGLATDWNPSNLAGTSQAYVETISQQTVPPNPWVPTSVANGLQEGS